MDPGPFWEELFILIAEDDPDDVVLLEHALERTGVNDAYRVVSDGQEAVDYLRGAGRFSNRKEFPIPTLLITDLRMPRMNGLELLKWLQDHPECQVIPTIVLSTSNLEEDVSSAYRLGVNSYFRKPTGFEELRRILQAVLEYWSLNVVPRVRGC